MVRQEELVYFQALSSVIVAVVLVHMRTYMYVRGYRISGASCNLTMGSKARKETFLTFAYK